MVPGRLRVSDEIRTAVDVHGRSGDIAVALGGQIGGDGGDLLGQAGASQVTFPSAPTVSPSGPKSSLYFSQPFFAFASIGYSYFLPGTTAGDALLTDWHWIIRSGCCG